MKTEFERAAADEEMYQHASAPMSMGINPTDGMPQPLNLASMVAAPPLRVDTMVCMADTSCFVIRDEWGDVMERFMPDVVDRAPDGSYRVLTSLLMQQRRQRHGWWARAFWWMLIKVAGEADGWSEVEPIRPACRFYARSLCDIAGESETKFVQRVCLAQKTDNGEYVTLRDSMVFACEIREPRDIPSEAELDRGDAERIANATKALADQEVFDPAAELAALKGGGGGIFSGNKN